MFVLKSAYVRHNCYFNNVSALNITHTDTVNVKGARVVSMKWNGSEQLDKGVQAKTIADEFGAGEITEKVRKNNENFREVNMRVASKVILNF